MDGHGRSHRRVILHGCKPAHHQMTTPSGLKGHPLAATSLPEEVLQIDEVLSPAQALASSMAQLMMVCALQAADYHNFGYFTSALAVNLLDRFMAAQPTSVSLKTFATLPCCLGLSTAVAGHLKGAWKGWTQQAHHYQCSLEVFDRSWMVISFHE